MVAYLKKGIIIINRRIVAVKVYGYNYQSASLLILFVIIFASNNRIL